MSSLPTPVVVGTLVALHFSTNTIRPEADTLGKLTVIASTVNASETRTATESAIIVALDVDQARPIVLELSPDSVQVNVSARSPTKLERTLCNDNINGILKEEWV